MIKEDFKTIVKMIRAIWKGAIGSDDAFEAWYNSLKKYDFHMVKDAVNSYIRIGKFEPKPADIIGEIKVPVRKGTFDPEPKYTRINGSIVRTYCCILCRDSGMVTWEDEKQQVIGVPHDCPAGHYYYTWGWLTIEEQQQYIKENGYHGEIIGENWYNLQPGGRRRSCDEGSD